jgi:magnesium transporter
VGSLLPLVAAKFGIDPALVSGPLMSTMVDATGLFIYFTIAKILLGL